MNLLVTGATGFVGKALIETACKLGHNVTAVVRTQNKFLPSEAKQVVAGDLAEIVARLDFSLGENAYCNDENIVISSEVSKWRDDSFTVGMISEEIGMTDACHSEPFDLTQDRFRRGISKEALITSTISEEKKINRFMSAMQDVDVVIHTAARAHVMKEDHDDPAAIYHLMNVTLTEKLAMAAADAGVKRFVFISSIKVNGELSKRPYSETDLPAPEDDYGRSKSLAEQSLELIGQRTGMEIVILRPPLIYGPGVKGNFASLIKWVNKGIPLPFGAIDNRRSLLALDNLVSAILLASQHPGAANQTFLLADDEAVSTSQLIKLIAQSQGKKARLIPVPVRWMQFVATVLGKKSVTDRLIGSLQVDASKIRRQLDWKPVTSMAQQLAKLSIERLD